MPLMHSFQAMNSSVKSLRRKGLRTSTLSQRCATRWHQIGIKERRDFSSDCKTRGLEAGELGFEPGRKRGCSKDPKIIPVRINLLFGCAQEIVASHVN